VRSDRKEGLIAARTGGGIAIFQREVPGIGTCGRQGRRQPPARQRRAKPGWLRWTRPPLTEARALDAGSHGRARKARRRVGAKGQPAPRSSSESPGERQPGSRGTVSGGEVASAVSPAATSTAPGTQDKASTKPAKAEPFAFADFTWLTGNPRTKESPNGHEILHAGIRADVDYVYDFQTSQRRYDWRFERDL